MLSTEISKELKNKIEINQNQLKEAIKDHQRLIAKIDSARIDGTFSKSLGKQLEEMQHRIIILGLEQKGLVEKLRREFKLFQETLKANVIKNGIEERRHSLSNAINRARKQNIISRSTNINSASPSEESEIFSSPSTPEPLAVYPLNPQDLCQNDFLTYFGLATHDVFKEIQNKRAERKRRRTANPQFLYTRGWDISKRKRNMYLANVSPPHTRQSARKFKSSSPTFKPSRSNSPTESNIKKASPGPTWPISLSLAHINLMRRSAEKNICIQCSAPENLLVCQVCMNGFHLSCHNRPLTHTPKHCPKCFKELVQAPEEIADKLRERDALFDKLKDNNARLSILEERYVAVEEMIKDQEATRATLNSEGDTVETKIKSLISAVRKLRDEPEEKEIKTEPIEPEDVLLLELKEQTVAA